MYSTPRPRIALYPGSFDLLTNGHLDLIRRGRTMFDRLVAAVGVNPSKPAGFFTPEERLTILSEATVDWQNVEVRSFTGLTVEFAGEIGAQFIIRGLRAVSDFEFELQLAIMNHQLNPAIETIFLAAEPENIFLSSRVVKDVWRHGGDIAPFVPPPVLRALQAKRALRIEPEGEGMLDRD
ncbi:pantetheine-phosphate adenylyltransferase [Candidatus Poribacteria bacterium]|nr:pantetheine-phosphate adenylyltransferase [Candidatus Poribacteria bacterium]